MRTMNALLQIRKEDEPTLYNNRNFKSNRSSRHNVQSCRCTNNDKPAEEDELTTHRSSVLEESGVDEQSAI
jgi:hypothetical protein